MCGAPVFFYLFYYIALSGCDLLDPTEQLVQRIVS